MGVTRIAQDNIELRTRFKTVFADVYPAIPVIWENQPKDTNGSPFPALSTEYVRVVLRQNDVVQISTGNPRAFRNYGTMHFYIQTKAGVGTGRNEEIAGLIGDSMSAKTVAGIVLRPAQYAQMGAVDEQWFHGAVTVRYESTFKET